MGYVYQSCDFETTEKYDKLKILLKESNYLIKLCCTPQNLSTSSLQCQKAGIQSLLSAQPEQKVSTHVHPCTHTLIWWFFTAVLVWPMSVAHWSRNHVAEGGADSLTGTPSDPVNICASWKPLNSAGLEALIYWNRPIELEATTTVWSLWASHGARPAGKSHYYNRRFWS